ncbi:hypothetical protein NQ314_005963 [Rhamnusium bicolor]|uniref:Uncharacterized protein n=1 Tax=Rhamnusium bicolor TaxID=1586634 RepID=A0AAV8ZD93_9CUCU|nr:hypothetical protein NQ314_005963 [Rhamnusium bicolor]
MEEHDYSKCTQNNIEKLKEKSDIATDSSRENSLQKPKTIKKRHYEIASNIINHLEQDLTNLSVNVQTVLTVIETAKNNKEAGGSPNNQIQVPNRDSHVLGTQIFITEDEFLKDTSSFNPFIESSPIPEINNENQSMTSLPDLGNSTLANNIFYDTNEISLGTFEITENSVLVPVNSDKNNDRESVPTRWNPTYYMLERFVKLYQYIAPILLKDPEFPAMVNASDLRLVEEVLQILAPIEQVSKEICGELYLTSSKIIPIINCLKQQLTNFYQEPELLLTNTLPLPLPSAATIVDANVDENLQSQSHSSEQSSTSLWHFHNALAKELENELLNSSTSGSLHTDIKLYLNQPTLPLNTDPLAYWNNAASAYNSFCFSKMEELGDKYDEVVCDRYYFPSKEDFTNLWRSHFKGQYGDRSGENMFFQLEENLKHSIDTVYKITHNEEDYAVSLCTPIMQRAARHLVQSSEILFVDATSNCDVQNHQLYFFATQSPAGGIPLGCIITNSQKASIFDCALKDLVEIMPFKISPAVIMTDDDLSE